tara:strand:- start:489 stop:611 length:123 start_codon:yes stop_codon:yes gene_type:complete
VYRKKVARLRRASRLRITAPFRNPEKILLGLPKMKTTTEC